MCETPVTIKQARESYMELYANLQRHEKSVAGAKAKLAEAQKILLKPFASTPLDEPFEVAVKGGLLRVLSARKTQKLENSAAGSLLEQVRTGLATELATYSMTDLRKWLAPEVIASYATESYGSRTVKVESK